MKSNKRFWVIGKANDPKNKGLEFHFFNEKIFSFPLGKSFIFLLNFAFLNLFTPFLTLIFKEKPFNQSIIKFKYPEYLMICCEYLLIERYKCQEESKKK